MKKPRIKPVHNKAVRVKGKTVGHYSISSSGKLTVRPKRPSK